jgi:hypothetical protein
MNWSGDLIWHLEGNLRGGDFIGVIGGLDMSHKVRVSRLSPTANARIYPTNTSGYICHLISLSLPQRSDAYESDDVDDSSLGVSYGSRHQNNDGA